MRLHSINSSSLPGEEKIKTSREYAAKAVLSAAFWKHDYLESTLGIQLSYLMAFPTDLNEHIIPTFMTLEESSAILNNPWALPGKLSKEDLDRLAGDYPAPEPGRLKMPADNIDKQAILDIIRKYDDWSFTILCEKLAEHDDEGGCAEGCGNNIDGGNPWCCPAKDFRELVCILTKAFPHNKQNPTFGGYY